MEPGNNQPIQGAQSLPTEPRSHRVSMIVAAVVVIIILVAIVIFALYESNKKSMPGSSMSLTAAQRAEELSFQKQFTAAQAAAANQKPETEADLQPQATEISAAAATYSKPMTPAETKAQEARIEQLFPQTNSNPSGSGQ
jgi:hypothetical protein